MSFKVEHTFIALIALFFSLGYLVGKSGDKAASAAPTAPAVAAPTAPAPAPVAVAPPPPPAAGPPTVAVETKTVEAAVPAPPAPPQPAVAPPMPQPTTAAAAPAPPPADPNTVWRVTVSPEDAFMGPATAPATVVIFSAFDCDTCAALAGAPKKLVEKYGEKVRVVFKHKVVPGTPEGILAAQASLSANAQGKFWAYYDKLFANPTALGREGLERLAGEAGLELGKLKADLDSEKYRGQVMKDSLLANATASNTMPNIIVNGVRVFGEKTLENIMKKIDEQLPLAGGKSYDDMVAGGKAFEQLDPQVARFVANDDSPAIGPKDAKIQLVAFEDFQ